MRKSGYYWVRFNADGDLTVAYWDGQDFAATGDDRPYGDSDLRYINETRIEPPKE